jgi:hypothetical protein
MTLRAAVLVALGIEDEVILPVEVSAVREIGQRHVGPDAGVLDGDEVLGGAVPGIAGDGVRPGLPAAESPRGITGITHVVDVDWLVRWLNGAIRHRQSDAPTAAAGRHYVN